MNLTVLVSLGYTKVFATDDILTLDIIFILTVIRD